MATSTPAAPAGRSDPIRAARPSLEAIFAPGTVAVIGASEQAGSVGCTLIENVIDPRFGGTVFPVHPHQASILGRAAYPTIAAVPSPVDLAVIAMPAPTVPQIVRECVDAGVKGAIITA